MTKETAIKLFESKQVRTAWNETEEKWYFSIQDVVEILTDSTDVKQYIKRMLSRDEQLKFNWGTICTPVEMEAADGRWRKIQAADVQGLLRIIQSVPSPKAEPFKQWLAKVGYERIQETVDPERSIDRARENWLKYGRSEKWIQQRMSGQETRNKLTDYWKEAGVKEQNEFATLTNIIHQEWTGLTVKQHKELKNLKSQNLRDHMSEAELIFTALAELSTRQIAESEQAKGFVHNAKASKKGGTVAKNARKELESETGKSVITGENFLPPTKTRKKLEE